MKQLNISVSFVCGPILISHPICYVLSLPLFPYCFWVTFKEIFFLSNLISFSSTCFYSSVWSGFTYFACELVTYFHTFRPFVYLLMDCNRFNWMMSSVYLCDARGPSVCHHPAGCVHTADWRLIRDFELLCWFMILIYAKMIRELYLFCDETFLFGVWMVV